MSHGGFDECDNIRRTSRTRPEDGWCASHWVKNCKDCSGATARENKRLRKALLGYMNQHSAAFRNFNDTDNPCGCELCRKARKLVKEGEGNG